MIEGDAFFLAAAHLARMAAVIFFLAAGLSLRALFPDPGLWMGFPSIVVRRARALLNLAISSSMAWSIKLVFMQYSILVGKSSDASIDPLPLATT